MLHKKTKVDFYWRLKYPYSRYGNPADETDYNAKHTGLLPRA